MSSTDYAALHNRSELPGGHAGELGSIGVAMVDDGPSRLDEISAHIKRDPGHSTRLIEAWISSDGDD